MALPANDKQAGSLEGRNEKGDRNRVSRVMKNPSLHRYAVLLAVCAFVLIAVGALLTSTIRPLPGTNSGPAGQAPGLEQIHLILAGIVGALTLGFAVWYRKSAGWIILAAAVIEAISGSYAPILHAILAPVLFSGFVAMAYITGENWTRPPVSAPDLWPPLRKMAILAPIFVVLQISLGAGFRHNETGVVWHILGAGVVLLLIMVLGICLLRQFPEHPTLRPAAIALLVITGVQVLLGFGVYMVVLIVSQNNETLVVSSVLHVLTGSLTLAASVMLALHLRRCDQSQTGH
jgi:heme A synthase